MARFIFPAVLLLVLFLVACGGSDDDGDDPTPTSSSSSPAASVSATDSTGEPPLVAPGTYSSEVFSPAVSVTIPDDGWRMGADVKSAFEIERSIPSEPANGFVAIFNVNQIRSQENFSTPEPVPPDLIAWLTNHRDIILVAGPTAIEIDGIAAQQIDVRTDAGYSVPLFDDFGLHFRDAARFIAVEVNGEAVLIYAGPGRSD